MIKLTGLEDIEICYFCKKTLYNSHGEKLICISQHLYSTNETDTLVYDTYNRGTSEVNIKAVLFHEKCFANVAGKSMLFEL